MQILLRIAVEEKFLKNRHVRGRDLVDDDDEIGSGDLLVLPYERLPFVPTRMLILKQWGAQCRQILPTTGRKLLGLPLRSCTPMRRASIAVRTCSSHRVCSSPFLGTSWGSLRAWSFSSSSLVMALPFFRVPPWYRSPPIRDAGRSMPRFLPDAGQISVRWPFRRPPVQASNASATAQAVVRKASESGLAGSDGAPIQRSPGVNPGVGVPSSCVSSFVEREVS